MEEKKSHFKLPEGYFQGFTDRIMDRISKEDTVLPKTDGFTMTKGYLDNFDLKIPQEIEEKETKVISLPSRKKWYSASVAVAAILLLFFGIRQMSVAPELTFEDLAGADIEAYFETNGLELSSYEIAESVSVDDLSFTSFLEEGMEEDVLLEYLEENVEDFENLNLEEDE